MSTSPPTEKLETWFDRIKAAKSSTEVLSILDKFRPLEWTDEQRSKMAHLYMRMLDLLGTESDDSQPAAQKKDAAAGESIKPAGQQTEVTTSTSTSTTIAVELGDEDEIEDGPVWYEKM